MRKISFLLVLIPGLLFACVLQAQAGRKHKAVSTAVKTEELPAINWGLTATGFSQVFKHRNEEIESAEPGRFFPGAVAFAMGRIDQNGHFLTLNCGSSPSCSTQRDKLEERVVFTSFLDSISTPKAAKTQLYDSRTWALTPLGETYMAKLHKRHPDLFTRLGKRMSSSMATR
jgi:hypothetical protein